MSQNSIDFIKKCLNIDPVERLGSKNGYIEILEHPWFQGLTPESLQKKEHKPDYVPTNEQEELTN